MPEVAGDGGAGKVMDFRGSTPICFRLQETRDNYAREYGLHAQANTAEILVKKLLEGAEEDLRVGEPGRLREYSHCILLLARCKEFRWANNNIINRLTNKLMDAVKTPEQGMARLCWVLSTIGLVSRVYTQEGRENLKGLYQAIEDLMRSGKLEPKTELVCVNTFLHLGYHLQQQVECVIFRCLCYVFFITRLRYF